MMTKDEERKVLEKIKKIVDALENDSYVKTAFDGVFEIAQENIENDFAGSCRDFIDNTHKLTDDVRELERKNAELVKQMDDLNKTCVERCNEIGRRSLSQQTATAVAGVIREKIEALRKEVSNAASRIVENANDPTCAGFKNAVKDHNAASGELERTEAILKSVVAIANR